VPKHKGHQRGTSHSKKKYDKYYRRNYYAKDLQDDKYHTRILPGRVSEPPATKTEILKELDDD